MRSRLRSLGYLAALVGAAGGLAACESSPRFDPTMPPIVGTIDEEERLVSDGQAAEISLSVQELQATVDVPAAALPIGTLLIVRRIHGVPFLPPPADDAGATLGYPDTPFQPGVILHFLPKDLAFTAPLVARFAVGRASPDTAVVRLYAADDDVAWTIVDRSVDGAPLEVARPGVYGFFYISTRPGPPRPEPPGTDAGGGDATH